MFLNAIFVHVLMIVFLELQVSDTKTYQLFTVHNEVLSTVKDDFTVNKLILNFYFFPSVSFDDLAAKINFDLSDLNKFKSNILHENNR